MKPLIKFTHTTDLFDLKFITVKCYNTINSKLLHQERIPERYYDEWGEKIQVQLTATIVDKAVKARWENYRFANYTDARINKAFTRLADLTRSCYTFANHNEQMTWIKRAILPWLNDIAPRDPQSYPSFHLLINHIEKHEKDLAKPVV